MDYRNLGVTGLKVSELCLGAMMFGGWGNPDHEDSIKVIHRAIDAGINFIDTADVYSAGESEQIVGKAIAGRRDSLVIATKVHGTMGSEPNMQGNSRRWIIQECENSLRRLGTDYIDLYQIHRPDPSTDVDEQPPYSMLVRGVEAEVLPTCQKYGMGVIPWSPLGGGWLSGRWRKGADDLTSRRAQRLPARYDLSIPANQAKLDAADALGRLADESGMTLIHMALAFVLQHPAVTAAIIGPRTMDHLDSQLGAVDVTLEPAILDRIDQLVPPGRNFSWADAGYEPPAVGNPSLRRRA
jgi:aryl-alcohol dehydrogenase-like predicted oxidoreductase